jgi:hypothetical protein
VLREWHQKKRKPLKRALIAKSEFAQTRDLNSVTSKECPDDYFADGNFFLTMTNSFSPFPI